MSKTGKLVLDVIARINAEMPVSSLQPQYPGEVAERWGYTDGAGEIGVISSVTQAFCSSCTRMRLSTEGMLYTCLFAGAGYDLRQMLRGAASDQDVANAIAGIWGERTDHYSELRAAGTATTPKVEMSYIGG